MGWGAKLCRDEDQNDESVPDIDLFDFDWEALPADILRKHVQKMTGSEDAGRMIDSSRSCSFVRNAVLPMVFFFLGARTDLCPFYDRHLHPKYYELMCAAGPLTKDEVRRNSALYKEKYLLQTSSASDIFSAAGCVECGVACCSQSWGFGRG